MYRKVPKKLIHPSPLLKTAGSFNFKQCSFKKLFKKVVSALLVFTFSWSQLLYAVDPRELLAQAKASFNTEDQRRGGGLMDSGGAQAQSLNEAVVDQQNTLQDLQNLNFSLTNQNGDILKYVDDKLSQIKRPDGATLKNIILSEEGKIQSADLRLSDGSIQILNDGKVIAYQTPGGTQVFYENGEIKKIVSKEGVETVYTYNKDPDGNLLEVVLESDQSISKYDKNFVIKEKIIKNTNTKLLYSPGTGILKTASTPEGLYSFEGRFIGQDIEIALSYFKSTTGIFYQYREGIIFLIQFPDYSVLREINFNEDGSLKSATLIDLYDNKYFYENGKMVRSASPDGRTFNYEYLTDKIVAVGDDGSTLECLKDGTLISSKHMDGTWSSYYTSGPYKGWKERDAFSSGRVFFYDYKKVGIETVINRRELIALRETGDWTGSDVSTIKNPTLKMKMTLNDISSMRIGAGGQGNSLSFYLTRDNYSYYSLANVQYALPISLKTGITYEVELTFEDSGPCLYIYEAGSSRPLTPTLLIADKKWSPTFSLSYGNISFEVNPQSSGVYTRSSRISHINPSSLSNFLSRSEFRFESISTANRISLTIGTNKNLLNIASNLSVSYSQGKWTFTKTDRNVITRIESTSVSSINQILNPNIDYIVEARSEEGLVSLYAYQKGTQPSGPIYSFSSSEAAVVSVSSGNAKIKTEIFNDLVRLRTESVKSSNSLLQTSGARTTYYLSGPFQGMKQYEVLSSGRVFYYEYEALPSSKVMTTQKEVSWNSFNTFVYQYPLNAFSSNPQFKFQVALGNDPLMQYSPKVALRAYATSKNLQLDLLEGTGSTWTWNGVSKSLGITLEKNTTYNAEMSWEAGKVAIYVYKLGAAKPTTPQAYVADVLWMPTFALEGRNVSVSPENLKYTPTATFNDTAKHSAVVAWDTSFKFSSELETNQLNFQMKQDIPNNIERTIQWFYNRKKWTVTVADRNISNNTTQTKTYTIDSVLLSQKEYAAEARFEGGKLNFYVYEKTALRPISPFISTDALPSSSTFNFSAQNAVSKSFVLKNQLRIFNQPIFDSSKMMVLSKFGNPTKPKDISNELGFKNILYDKDWKIKEALLPDKSKVIFENGVIKQALDSAGNQTSFNFSESFYSNLLGADITQNGLLSHYDENGNLSSLKLGSSTVHYSKGSSQIDFIENVDGTELHDIVFDVNGNILDARVITPEGDEKIYEGGYLKRVRRSDQSELYFEFDAQAEKSILRQLVTGQKIAYNFSYAPEMITAKIEDSLLLPDASVVTTMNYDKNFNLKKAVLQNNEIIHYTEQGQIDEILTPGVTPKVFRYQPDGSYSVVQGDLESFYDLNNQIYKSIISPSQENPSYYEVLYQYAKIRQISKDGVLVFKYSYVYDTEGQEMVRIEDLIENSVKSYRDSELLTILDKNTHVLSTYFYQDGRLSKVEDTKNNILVNTRSYSYSGNQTTIHSQDGKTQVYLDNKIQSSFDEAASVETIYRYQNGRVFEVKVSRLGRALHTYQYSYENTNTVVTDEEGTKRTYNSTQRLIFLEKMGQKFEYAYILDQEGALVVEERLLIDLGAEMDPSTIIIQEYSQDGTLQTQTKADGTILLFENNKPSRLTSTNGEILIEYAYDLEGNIQSVYLKKSREELPKEVLKARASIESQRLTSLQQLAAQKNLVTASIDHQVASQKQALLAQLGSLQNQFGQVSGIKVSGKKAKNQRGDALNQIGHAMDDIRGALANLDSQTSDAYAQLDSQVKTLSDQIASDARVAFTALEAQQINLQNEILRQETSPIIFDYYRRIIGRDPSSSEYSYWVQKINYALPGKTLSGEDFTADLKDYVTSLPELAERKVYVQKIKNKVGEAINNYLLKSEAQKKVFAEGLGLSEEDLILLSPADAQRIMTWLSTRSLHFGQSAFLSLESLLDQKGIPYAREDLAQKAILIDVLTGIISPLDDGDLVLSMFALNKVAQSYGLALSGASLRWEDLLLIYQFNPTAKIIAHINGNHYVVIQSVTSNSLTYMDPGRGKDKQNEVMTLSKRDFLKGWRGNVTLEQAKLEVISGYQTKTLSAEKTKKIRGAFFFFFVPMIIGALSSIGGVVASVIAGVGALIGSVGALVGSVLSTIGQVLSGVGGLLQGLGASIFQGISFAASSLVGAFGNIGSFLSQNVFGSLAKAGFGDALFQQAVSVGLSFATSKGLESLGVNSTITSFASAFLTGGINAFFDPKTVLSVGSFIAEGIQGLVFQGTQTLLTSVGLDTNLSSVLSLASGKFVNGILDGNLGGQLVKIGQSLSVDLGRYGIDRLGAAIGLPSIVSAAIGSPITASLSQGFQSGNLFGQNIIKSVQEGLINGAIAYGVDFASRHITNNTLLQALSTRVLSGAIEGALLQKDIFKGVYGALKQSILGVFSNNSSNIITSAISFSSLVAQQGMQNALEVYLGNIFNRQSVESIQRSGGLAYALNSPKEQITLPDGRGAQIARVASGEGVLFDQNNNLLGFERNGLFQIGEFGIGDNQAFGLISGKSFGHFLDGTYFEATVVNGNTIQITTIQKDRARLDIEAKDTSSDIAFDSDGQVIDGKMTLDQKASLVVSNGTLEGITLINQTASTVSNAAGFAYQILQALLNGSNSQESSSGIANKIKDAITTAFIFGNGFENEWREEDTHDPLMKLYVDDLEFEQPKVINEEQKIFVDLYEYTKLLGNAFDWLAEFDPLYFFTVLRGLGLTYLVADQIVQKVINDQPLDSSATQNEKTFYQTFQDILRNLSQQTGIGNSLVLETIKQMEVLQSKKGRLKDAIAFAHSGFAAPILSAIEQKQYDVETVLIFEGPHPTYNTEFTNPNLKRIIHVMGKNHGFPDLSGDGDAPVPFLGLANFDNTTHTLQNINIEIEGAWHSDYAYNAGDYADHTFWDEEKAQRQIINRRTNLFMRDLYEAAYTDQTKPDDLNKFFDNLKAVGAAKAENGILKINPSKLRDVTIA